MKTKAIAIFGYNNTRIYDVLKIRELVRSRGAEIVLIKKDITAADLDMTHYCFDHLPEDPNITNPLIGFLEKNSLELIGCLPFSDKGVVGAAHVSKNLNLFGDDASSSEAMLDKYKFRQLEAKIAVDDGKYKKPFFYVLNTVADLEFLLEEKGAFFVKPTSEGNSRGCMKIENKDDLELWCSDNSNQLDKGVICEEILANKNEFSFDGVNETYWITQKFTTAGAFKAEYQHIIPAPLSASQTFKVHSVLAPLLKNLGSNGGAFHHEFFMLDDGRIASVEPNRRPAGMKLWDISSWAFGDFNPWEIWIDKCMGKMPPKKELTPSCFAGVRGVISDRKGKITTVNYSKIKESLHALLGDRHEFMLLKSEGASVNSVAKDNSDFVAFIATKDPVYISLLEKLEIAEKIILDHIEVVP